VTALWDNLRLALGTFVQNPLRSFLTLLGLVIGVATVISMMGMIEGLRIKVNEDFSSLGANGFQVQKMPVGFGDFDFQKLSKRPNLTLQDRQAIAESCPSVLMAAGEEFEGGQKASTAQRETKNNVGVWAGTPEYFETNAVTIAQGRAFNAGEYQENRRVAVVGADIAEVLFPGANPLGQTLRLRGQLFTILGVLLRKGSLMGGGHEDRNVMIPLSTFSEMYGASRSVQISMLAVASDKMQKAQDEVTMLLRKRRHLAPAEPNNFEIFSNDSVTKMLNQLSTVVTAASFGVCVLSLLVGGIGILNIMLVAVTERTREIGLRKALGARRRRILAQFATEAVLLALVGGALGVGVGFGLGGLARWLVKLPVQVPTWAVAVSLGMSTVVGLGFGIYPAARASALDPVEAMRVD
jgi:putative ABC transport system permease protein